jgi:hypothetical protein
MGSVIRKEIECTELCCYYDATVATHTCTAKILLSIPCHADVDRHPSLTTQEMIKILKPVRHDKLTTVK